MPHQYDTLLPFLKHMALELRVDSIRATTAAGSGHPTSCLSVADIVAAIFFHALRFDIRNPHNSDNDRCILSKGHAIPVIYAAWKALGVISDEELLSLRKFSSSLEGHPTPRLAYNEAATGSLGQGLSIGLGMALAAEIDHRSYVTYVIMGDAEIAEGSVWEAAMLAGERNTKNLIGIVDINRLGQSTTGPDKHDISAYARKFAAFGWLTLEIDGHNMQEIVTALDRARSYTHGPVAILARTIKGYGLADRADKMGYHGKPLTPAELVDEMMRMRTQFAEDAAYKIHKPYLPPSPPSPQHAVPSSEKFDALAEVRKKICAEKQSAPRKAFGQALAALSTDTNLVVLDADVKNSTYTELFETQAPQRFIECLVAEQNMVGIACGLALRNKKPVAATFGAFFSRAFDQIRMAGIGRCALRLAGSHVGVSIGEDGPSQMALEDIAMMRTVPHSIVLYPSDGSATIALVQHSLEYDDGISYLRLTRGEMACLYDEHELFPLGGCKVLRQSDHDKLCIVTAGITLHEALAAYETLKALGVHVSIVDLYSVKPLDRDTLLHMAERAQNLILTVEDHYEAGGIGEAVSSALSATGVRVHRLTVPGVPRSGTTRELLAWAGIDQAGIVRKVQEIL